jgi:hypothetical protein
MKKQKERPCKDCGKIRYGNASYRCWDCYVVWSKQFSIDKKCEKASMSDISAEYWNEVIKNSGLDVNKRTGVIKEMMV